MSELRILLVDDEPLARLRLRQLLGPLPHVRVLAECGSVAAAQLLLLEGAPVDLVLLDIELPDATGLDLVERLGPDRMPPVVFVTAHDHYAVRAFDANAIDYVRKPVRAERLHEAIARVQSRRIAEHALALTGLLRTVRGDNPVASPTNPLTEYLQAEAGDGRGVVLLVEQIDWLEAQGHYVRLHAGRDSYLRRDTLRSLEQRLDPRRFARVHRSAIVNLARVSEAEVLPSGDAVLRLQGGRSVRLSRAYRARFDRLTGG